jgi:GBP family porin
VKRTLLNAAIGSCIATLATPLLAQSSLSIYGIADVGVQMSWFGGGPQHNIASGIVEGSRIGFKGTEDMGGGYKAIFTLEQRVELDTGATSNTFLSPFRNQNLTRGVPPPIASSPLLVSQVVLPPRIVNVNNGIFDRTAAVGLITPIGAFILGRQYTPGYEVFAGADTFEVGRAGSWGNIANGSAGFITPGVAIRYNSALQYRLQLPNGIGASLMYGFEETGSTNFARRALGGNLRYEGNGFKVGVGYNREQDQLGRKSLTTTTVGGSYAFGDAKLFAGYHRMENPNSYLTPLLAPFLTQAVGPVAGPAIAGIIGNNARVDAHVYTLGGHYRFGSNRLLAAVSHTNDKLPTDGDSLLYALGYDYFLSKRTDLYAAVAHIRNSNRAQLALGGAGYVGGATATPGQDGNAVQFGVRHRF